MQLFVNRSEELGILEKEYRRKEAAMVVLYGRRRVGKTALLAEFLKGKPGLYFLATEESEEINRQNFRELVADFLRDDLLRGTSLTRWEDVFLWLLRQKSPERMVIALDEFQYLGKANKAFPSILQKIWDQILSKENVMLVLCGSLVSMMVSQTLSYDSPLYGRRTAQIRLAPVPFRHYGKFFPQVGKTARELVELYAVTGGVPRYIQEFRDGGDIYAAIEEHVFRPSAFLFDEPRFLLQHEVGEVGGYFSILRAIAAGNRKLSKIATVLRQKQTNLPRYLNVLQDLDLLEREIPITEAHPEKSKKGIYRIKDNFIAFWFSFVYPNLSYIESGHAEIASEKLRRNFVDHHVGFVYEGCCRELLWQMSAENKLPFRIGRAGRWWDNHGTEIDVVALAPEENCLLAGECKFWKSPVGMNVLVELQRKAQAVEWKKEDRKTVYALFSIEGFTEEIKAYARRHGDVILMDGRSFV